MIFSATELPGAMLVELERREDERGFFARAWCRREFEAHGLPGTLVQASISHTTRRGTIRGLHYQTAPHEEDKLVRCTHGAAWDVILDLRPGSPTYLRHLGIELTAENGRALFVPRGFAHGFQTLRDDTRIFYQMTEFHEPEAARGVRWNDPLFGIAWPIPDPVLHPRDAAYPDYRALA